MTRFSTAKVLLGLMTTAAISAGTLADTRWLSDELWVNLRAGASDSASVLQTIASGTRMETLSDEAQNGYLNVRTEQGTEGWIPRRYTQTTPTASLRLSNLEAERDQLQQQLNELQQRHRDLLANRGDVSGELESLRVENERLATELNEITQISGDAINLDQRNKDLSEDNARLKNDLDLAQSQLSEIRESNDSSMLLAGGALIFVGLVLGIVLPRIRAKRRDSWA
ncbi:TIGR04211 family SH3 domain-containing protein [Saccharospirillum mangrovi]|uniref:TIGR04211 family SH3 domain-containing protein n=1 Tax=Saccharospirillum mangrovi TaxID=2161747 RepID=UPI0013007745|nr:TIGR04211 family SH3 domain-containing protein [Saccharospirillum mangrovi]